MTVSASIYSWQDRQGHGCEITISAAADKVGGCISKGSAAITGKLVWNMLNYPQSGASGGAGVGGKGGASLGRDTAPAPEPPLGPQGKHPDGVRLHAAPSDVHQGAVAGARASVYQPGGVGGWVASWAPPCDEGGPWAFSHSSSGSSPLTPERYSQAPSLAAFGSLGLYWAAKMGTMGSQEKI